MQLASNFNVFDLLPLQAEARFQANQFNTGLGTYCDEENDSDEDDINTIGNTNGNTNK